MKKTITISIAFLFGILGLNAQTLDLMSLDSIKRSYNMEEVTTFEYDQYGNLIKYMDGFHKFESVYNQDNQIIELLVSMLDYDDLEYRFREKIEADYDNSNNIIEMTTYNYENQDWMPEFKTINTYSNNNLVEKKRHYYVFEDEEWQYSSLSTYGYDSHNLLVTVYSYSIDIDENRNLYEAVDYQYNSSNQLSLHQIRSFNSQDTTIYTIAHKYHWEYSPETTIMKHEYYNPDMNEIWKWQSKEVYHHGPNNEVTMREYFNYKESQWEKYLYDSFSFDSIGNQVFKTRYRLVEDNWRKQDSEENIFDYDYPREELLLPKDVNLETFIFSNYLDFTHMLSAKVNSSYSNPDNSMSRQDSTCYYYSIRTIGLFDIENISYNNLEFTLYPNPSKDHARLALDNLKQDIVITILDLKGNNLKTIKAGPINQRAEIELDLHNLSSGVYLINIQSGRYSATKRLIIAE